jgi:hypothetical protein
MTRRKWLWLLVSILVGAWVIGPLGFSVGESLGMEVDPILGGVYALVLGAIIGAGLYIVTIKLKKRTQR